MHYYVQSFKILSTLVTMKKALVNLLLIHMLPMNFLNVTAQNLVPNYSFEDYNSCPTTGGQIQYCNGWSQYSIAGTTPDYYNACSLLNEMGVPLNIVLYQSANSGEAYVGMATWVASDINEREQIGIKLTQPLVVGQTYYLSFYTVRGGFKDNSDCPSNNVGMRLSTVSFSPSNPAPIDNFAHLYSNAIISDTANWVQVSGSIVADSTYQYLMLGNFFDDAHTDTLTQTFNSGSYYLIDDVCVSADVNTCFVDSSNSVVITQNSNYNIENFNTNVITPNDDGINDYLDFSVYNLKQIHFTIYNRWGNIVFQSNEPTVKWNGKSNDGKPLLDGVYFYLISAKMPDGKQINKHNYISIFN